MYVYINIYALLALALSYLHTLIFAFDLLQSLMYLCIHTYICIYTLHTLKFEERRGRRRRLFKNRVTVKKQE